MRVIRLLVSLAMMPALAVDAGAGQVVAVVDGEAITMSDVERYWQAHDAPSFARVQQQLYDAKQSAFDGLLAELLLSQEARRAGLTVDDLALTIERSVAPPSADDVTAMYDRSAASKQGLTLEQASPVIDAYLRQQKTADARKRLVARLRAAASIDMRIRFDPPRQPVRTSPADPMIGDDDAPVKIVEFSDFECPYCRQTAPVLKQIAAAFGRRVAIVWKDYPLPAHASARGAAEAAQCAHEQGKFWSYHDMLFAHADALSSQELRRYAEGLALDMVMFDRCIASATYRPRVLAGVDEGKLRGVSATPTLFINGRMIVGSKPFEDYERVVLDELRRSTDSGCGSGLCALPAAGGH